MPLDSMALAAVTAHCCKPQVQGVPGVDVQTRELYHSANGDRWYLAYDSATGAFIRHEPNRASGGKVSNIEIGTFLSQPGQGPEKQELLRLIGTLISESSNL
jgi:hypothetical protein